MDFSTDSGTPPIHTALLSSSPCQTESGQTVLLQLLEFKTHLLEVVEELHIRRDAETRYEDQISKLVLEKQELEWEKESLQHQIETVTKQHTEAVTTVKKQFQAKLRNTEEEKGKYQVTVELKDKEINNLKEELKSLQLLKYNLEKTSSELEQKLALQNRTRDTHLNQLGEVEKRFNALSRQCAIVKQAHEKLEQNVDEAMRINQKQTSANQRQEAVIVSLKKELDEVSNRLIKVKMTSFTHDKSHSPARREQHVQELQQKLSLETEMNKKLGQENLTERAEKQELMKSLQHIQQLLLSQTQTVRRVELELQTQTQMYQALKREHEVMRDKSKAVEGTAAQLTETYAASKTHWDKEKMMFLDRIKAEQEALQEVKEAYDELHQKNTELSLQTKAQAEHMNEKEVRTSNRVSTQQFPSTVGDIRGKETLNETISRPELPGLNRLHRSDSSQTKNPERMKDTEAASKLAATGSNGGQDTPNHHQEHISNHHNTFTCSFTPVTNALIKNLNSSETAHIIVSGQSEDKCEDRDREMNETEQGKEEKQEDNIREREGTHAGQQNREEFPKDVSNGRNAGETRTLVAQTTDRTDMHEDSVGSAKGTAGTSNPETETEDRAEGEVTDGVKDRGQTAEHAPETQIPTQTTTDTTEKSLTPQVNDFMDTQLPLNVCDSSDFTQKVIEKDADCSNLDRGFENDTEAQKISLDERHGVIQEVQPLCHDAKPLNQQSVCRVIEKPTHVKNSKETPEDVPEECSEVLKQSRSAQTNGQSHHNTNDQEREVSQTQTTHPSDAITTEKQTDETFDTRADEGGVLVRKLSEPQALSLNSETQESGQLGSVVADDEDRADERTESESNVKTPVKSPVRPSAASHLKETMEAVNLKRVAEHMKTDQVKNYVEITEMEADLKLPANPSRENEESSKQDAVESPLPCKKTYRSLLEWGAAQRKALSSRAKSEVCAMHQLTQDPCISGQNTTGTIGLRGHPPSTLLFIRSKNNKVPSLITRASDLLNTSSVSGAAASSRREQQGESDAKDETCRETAAGYMDGIASQSIDSSPVSTSSCMGSKLSWQTIPGRAPAAAADPGSESGCEPSCSQEREDQESSFRAQIDKIEQFLNTERLHLTKRRRTDN
ncbi:coiled-coil domain-containing protein 73 [Odontesthes bonariensis]|uniref:coiled-coil domain-containing protein 73 n=1 Tax=Odontesthes bonariensis TaxID=219752 RepID=UPI003F582F47